MRYARVCVCVRVSACGGVCVCVSVYVHVREESARGISARRIEKQSDERREKTRN